MSMQDIILDGITLLESKKCPDCNAPMEYWSMPDYDANNKLQGRIRRWWHFEQNKDTNCPRMWDHV